MSMTSTYSSPEQTTPLLSFVMPAYKGQWLSSAVESILAQTYTNIELIVVNDCSRREVSDEAVGALHPIR